MPLTLKVGDVDALVRSVPAGTGVERGKAQDGGVLVTLAKGNDGRVLRFTPAGNLLILAIEHRAMSMPAYRKSVLDFIWQHGTPNYIYLPKVAGYPAGAEKACLSPGSKPGKAIVDTVCLKQHLPKAPQAFASWVATYIARTGRQPDLFWSCKTSASGPEILAEKSEPPDCFVKIYAGNDCTGVGDRATCHQFVKYANFPPASGPPKVARAEQQKKDPAAPGPPRAGNERRDTKSFDDLVSEGKTALAQDKPDVALRKFRIAKMKAGGASPELQQLIAEAENKLDAPGGVTDEDKQRKERIRAALRTATEAGALRNYDAQIGALSEVLEIDPGNINALKSRQQVYERAGKPELALKDAETLIARDPSDKFAQRDVARLQKRLKAATPKVASEQSAELPRERANVLQFERLEKPYDINGLPLDADLAKIEKFVQERAGKSFKRKASNGEVRLEGEADDGSWSVVYDTNNDALLRVEFTSRRIPEQKRRETYAALMRKYGMPYYIKTDYDKKLSWTYVGSSSTPRSKADADRVNQCFKKCCGERDKMMACAEASKVRAVDACFNDCYYPKPPQDVESLLEWLFAGEPPVAQQRILYNGVMPTFWSCARSQAGDVLRNREQRACYVSFDVNSYKIDFKYNLQFENAAAIRRYDEQQALIRKEAEKIEREKARQAQVEAYRSEKAAKEARYAAVEQQLAQRYSNLDDTRRDMMREAWRSYEDFKVWMANELKQAYWQSVPAAEREKRLIEALTTNVELKGGPRYSDAHTRNAARDYLRFERMQLTFDVIEIRALIDRTTNEAEFQQIADGKARRKAVIEDLKKRAPERMQAYFAELEKIRHCYNNGSVEAGRIAGAMTYRKSTECSGYTTARDVKAGTAKTPNWEP